MLAFVINSGAISFERFDGETVIVNFERGTYLSLTGAAPDIFQLMTSPQPLANLAAAVAAAGGGAADAAALPDMLKSLVAEGCLLEVADDGRAVVPTLALAGGFVPPQVQAFHDLQELIAIDPVHDADAFDGWPHRPPSLTLS